MLALMIRVMLPPAKECPRPPEAGGGKEQILPYGLRREHGPAASFIQLRDADFNSAALSHQVYRNLLWQPQETNTIIKYHFKKRHV